MQIIDRFKQYLQGGPEGQGGGGAEENSPRLPGTSAPPPSWTPEALARLNQVHEGLLREIVRERIALYAQKGGATLITVELMEAKYGEWRERGGHWTRELPWSPEAQERVDRAPELVRGTIIQELEQYARERGRPEVTLDLIEEARATRWQARQMYHAQS